MVKLPAVLQYAHKLAKLAGENLRDHVNVNDFKLAIRTELAK